MKPSELLRSRAILLAHIFVWAALFLVPFLYVAENPEAVRFAKRNCLMMTQLAITFYANYLWAIDKLIFKKKIPLFVIFNILLFVILMFGRRWANGLIDVVPDVPHERPRFGGDGMMKLFVFNDLVFSILAICASFGIKHVATLHQIEMERKRLENETLTSELSLLRYQIQPHFFFNCLNNIYSLIGISPKDAQKSVHSLSRMMRFVLYDSSSPSIPLAKEIDFLNNYIALMKLRLSPKAQVEVSFPDGDDDVSIPSLLLVPLVENAFKHGVAPGGDADICCRMTLDGERLRFEVTNKIFETQKDEDRSHSGIGVANLRKRLEIMYGNQCLFDAKPTDDGLTFRAVVEFPLSDVNSQLKTDSHGN